MLTTSDCKCLDFPGKAAMRETLKSDAEFAMQFLLKLDVQWWRLFVEAREGGEDLSFFLDTWRAAEMELAGDLTGIEEWQDKYLACTPA